MEKIELKISSKSDPSKVAGAIAEFMKEYKLVTIRTIGAGAVNQAMKAIAIARGFVVPQGFDISCAPSFYKTEINGDEISAILITLRKVQA